MKILVLCTGNSCRSQMAEGFLRHYGGDRIDVKSGGLLAAGVHSRAIQVMAEIGINISGHTSNEMYEYLDDEFDYVITVCDHAAANCPVFPGKAIRVHMPVEDPVGTVGTEEEILATFREARDIIGAKMKEWLKQNV